MNGEDGTPTETKIFWGWVLMTGTGAWLGFLSGLEVIPYAVAAGFVVAAVAVFMVWAIWNSDPAELTDESDST
jgi:hypothetical protein